MPKPRRGTTPAEPAPPRPDHARLGSARLAPVPHLTAHEAVTEYFNQAARLIHLDDEMAAILRSSYREIAVQVPLRLDNGELLVARGYRVQHNGARGPYKGGIRYHPSADLDEVRALLRRALGALPEAEIQRHFSARRRPRRSGKPR